jgi:hypothetical protein
MARSEIGLRSSRPSNKADESVDSVHTLFGRTYLGALLSRGHALRPPAGGALSEMAEVMSSRLHST